MTPELIVLRVLGNPVTQGSKRPFIAGGRAYVRETGGQKHKDWRQAVAEEARRWQESSGVGLLAGPVIVECDFKLLRPASAPKRTRTWPIKARSGDIDKLARSILDSLTGVILGDDAQVVTLVSNKDWAQQPGVEVTIRPAPEGAWRSSWDVRWEVPEPAEEPASDGLFSTSGA